MKPLQRHTMSKNNITHTGVVDGISGDIVHVRIVQASACSSCKVASHCTASESKEKIVDVRCDNPSRFAVGQEVTVEASASVGFSAVVIAFVVPVVTIMMTVVFALQCGASELKAALAGLAILIPYYIILYMFRSRLERIMTFRIS